MARASAPDLRAALAAFPDDGLVPVRWVKEHLPELEAPRAEIAPAAAPQSEPTWRERLWTCPPETRLGVEEAAEALGWTRQQLYNHTSPSRIKGGTTPIPCRRLEGSLLFLAGDLREWIQAVEEEVHPSPGSVAPRLRASRGGGR